MSVNDILVQGGKPFIFLDYISINKILQKKLKDILKGIYMDVKLVIVNWLVAKPQKCQVHILRVNLILLVFV